jgi:cytokinin riboside 5'-monophosphate phosphoribohydrolase
LRICVFCSSSDAVDGIYLKSAQRLGALLARNGHDLVYGGAATGLMRAVAEGAAENGAHVLGIMPRAMVEYGLAFDGLDDLIVTETMAERKAEMERRADAFLALPGGFGTLEELFQVLVEKQLGDISAPVLLVNLNGYWDRLLEVLEQFYALHFAKEDFRALYAVCSDVEGAVACLSEARNDTALPPKWF